MQNGYTHKQSIIRILSGFQVINTWNKGDTAPLK